MQKHERFKKKKKKGGGEKESNVIIIKLFSNALQDNAGAISCEPWR